MTGQLRSGISQCLPSLLVPFLNNMNALFQKIEEEEEEDMEGLDGENEKEDQKEYKDKGDEHGDREVNPIAWDGGLGELSPP